MNEKFYYSLPWFNIQDFVFFALKHPVHYLSTNPQKSTQQNSLYPKKIQDFTNIYLCLCMSVSSHTFTVHGICLLLGQNWERKKKKYIYSQKLKVVHQMKEGKTRKTRCEDVSRVSKNKQLHNCVFWL